MIGGLLTGIAASPWMRSALRYGAIALAVLLFLFALRRSGERAGRLAERPGRSRTVIDRIAPFFWTAGGLGRPELRSRALVTAVGALLWLLAFLIPFLVARISVVIPRIAGSVRPRSRTPRRRCPAFHQP